MYNVNINNQVKDTKTIGELVNELQKVDPDTPIRLMCDHSCSAAKINNKQGYLHHLHLEIDFEYVRKDPD